MNIYNIIFFVKSEPTMKTVLAENFDSAYQKAKLIESQTGGKIDSIHCPHRDIEIVEVKK